MLTTSDRGKHAGKAWSCVDWRRLRNYFVSRAASAGVSFIHVMQAIGHDSFALVRHYFRLNDDAYREDFKKSPSGLTGVDLSGRGLTQERNTLGTHRKTNPVCDKGLGPERAGFEPAVRNKPHTGFRNRLLQPLGHLSKALASRDCVGPPRWQVDRPGSSGPCRVPRGRAWAKPRLVGGV